MRDTSKSQESQAKSNFFIRDLVFVFDDSDVMDSERLIGRGKAVLTQRYPGFEGR